MSLWRRDIHTLSGAYALDALEPAERERFERHLVHCRACADEVRSLTSTANRLAFAAAETPPPDMRSRVLAAATVVSQLPPETAPSSSASSSRQSRSSQPQIRLGPARSPWGTRLAGGFAAVCLAVAVTFGIYGYSAHQQLQSVQTQNHAIAGVLAAPDAQVVSQSVTNGGTATVVLSRSERRVVVSTSGLPTLTDQRVYQLWFIGPSRVASAGLVPAASGGKTAPVLASGLETQDKLGMTVEPAGGTAQPTTTPILVMTLPN